MQSRTGQYRAWYRRRPTSHERPSFARHLRAGNRSPTTIRGYLDAVDQFDAFLAGRDAARGGRHPARARRVVHRGPADAAASRQRRRTATVGLQQFFRWLVDEGEIGESPMAADAPADHPETPPPVLTPDQLKRLLAACAGSGFDERRDTAIVMLLIDTGSGWPRSPVSPSRTSTGRPRS